MISGPEEFEGPAIYLWVRRKLIRLLIDKLIFKLTEISIEVLIKG